jgi:hypothetical protein
MPEQQKVDETIESASLKDNKKSVRAVEQSSTALEKETDNATETDNVDELDDMTETDNVDELDDMTETDNVDLKG